MVTGDTVYTSYPDSGGPDGAGFVLAAFALKTGKPLWRSWIDSEVNATPVVYRDRVYVASLLGTLYTFGAGTGKVIAAINNRVATPPVITARGLLFGRAEIHRDNNLLASAYHVLPAFEEASPEPQAVIRKPRPLLTAERLITVEDGVVMATHRHTGQSL